ncbi:putative CmcJ-like methyltransferase [Macrophomina phaseolina]|uniref:CmcJ-like methyltransferase n=1 Tax=Macrophomina phaseolina TaxID=35725 RepID=A0ABQ8G7T5_9PEZI|nr:putative CmcJ-like methyltransferase [Macrophomina phaseolina]
MDTLRKRVIHSHAHFLQRDVLYEKEKPYSLRYTPPEAFPRANIRLEKHGITVHDVRSTKDELSFKEDGCVVMDLRTEMQNEDWDSEAKIKSVYLLEVADMLCRALNAVQVQIFEHTVRKRHETFPISTGQPYKYNQPTSIAHVDTTVRWVLEMVRSLNPDNADEIVKHRVQCVNVWKPLVGPVKDWPLALCKPQTIDPSMDLEPCDLVYPDYVVENQQVYFSEDLEWLYLSDQQPHEAWVFLQADTDPSGKPGKHAFDTVVSELIGEVPHTAFPLPDHSGEEAPRESIEVRALVYYGGVETSE